MNRLWTRYQMLLSYFGHSVLSTLLDVLLVWILLQYTDLDITVSNTCGIAAGFLIGFFLDVKCSFLSDYTPLTFAVYLGTFLLGLVLADVLITAVFFALESRIPQIGAFAISKGVSVAVPFFVLYFIRKYAYRAILKRREKNE